MKQWHTDPPVAIPEEAPPAGRELSDMININENIPLFKQLQTLMLVLTDKQERQWVQSLLDGFDMHVTRMLHNQHVKPWDRDYVIRDTYKRTYNMPANSNLLAIMSRLLTYREVVQYQERQENRCNEEGNFLKRPRDEQERPIWSLSRRILTGLNPVHPRMPYHVTYERPWGDSKRLDPLRNYGVYIDMGKSYTQDKVLRTLMACCGEPVGRTEGCWMALKEDTTAIEGIVKPYRLGHTIFSSAWERIVNSNAKPLAVDIAKDYDIGTAFKDYAKYEQLHKRIQVAWAAAAQDIEAAYKTYVEKLEESMDKSASNAGRNTNPFATLSKESQDRIARAILLQHEYNDIQNVKQPIVSEYVNQHIFRVSDMLQRFTYENLGVEIGAAQKLRFLSTSNLESVEKVDGFVKTIKEARQNNTSGEFNPGGKYFFLLNVSKAALDLQNQLQYFQRQQVNYALIKDIVTTNAQLAKRANTQAFQQALAEYEDIVEETIERQAEITDALKTLRAQNPVSFPPKSDLRLPQLLPQPTALEATRVEVFGEALAEQAQKGRAVSGNVPTNMTGSVAVLYGSINAAIAAATPKAPTVLPELKPERLNSISFVQVTKKQYEDAMEQTNAKLGDIASTKLPGLLNQLLIVAQSTYDLPVKEEALSKLQLEDAIKLVAADIPAQLTLQTNTFNAYVSARKKALEKYQTEQTVNVTTAKVALGALKPSTTTTTLNDAEDVRREVDKILAAVAPLEAIDDYQVYMEFNRSLKNMRDGIPQPSEFVPNEQYKTVADLQAAYVAKWTGQPGLLAAASDLARALRDLLDNLADPTKANAVAQIIQQAKTRADEAGALIETREAREKRLAEEERKKREAEEAERKRLAEEQRKQDERVLNANRDALPKLVNWLNMSGQKFFGESSLGLYDDGGLRDPSIRYTQEEKQLVLFNSRGELPRDFNVGVPLVESPYTKVLYNSMSPEIESAWKAFGDYVLHRGTSKQAEKRQQLDQQLIDYVSVLPEQPLKVERLEKTVPLRTYTSEWAALRTPDNAMFYQDTFVWKDNSCWLDSTFLAMFAYPKNRLAQRVLTGGLGWLTTLRVTTRQGASEVSMNCRDVDLKELHENIASDIIQIESPLTDTSKVCNLRTRDLWTKCVKYALPVGKQGKAVNAFGTASAVLETLKDMYNLVELENTAVDFDIPTQPTTSKITVPTNVPSSVRIYTVDTQYQPRVADPRTQLDVDFEPNGFRLYAITCGDGTHFVTYLRDFYRDEWFYINVGEHNWSIKPKLENTVHNLTGPGYKPLVYYYMRREDVQALMPTKKLQPKPSATAPSTLPFSTDPSDTVFPFGDNQRLEILFAQTITTPPPTWLTPQGRVAALLDREWWEISAWVNTLDRVRLEGLLHAWYAVRVNDEQRFVVGVTRADIDLDDVQFASVRPSPPPPSALVSDYYIYTTGMMDPDVSERWQNDIMPWLQSKLQGKAFKVVHYDGVGAVSSKYLDSTKESAIQSFLKFAPGTMESDQSGVDFDSLPGVMEQKYVLFDFAHALDYKKTISYRVVRYPYPINKYTKRVTRLIAPFEDISNTFTNRLLRGEYQTKETSMELSPGMFFDVTTIDNINTTDAYVLLMHVIRDLNLVALAKRLNLGALRKEMFDYYIRVGDVYDATGFVFNMLPRSLPSVFNANQLFNGRLPNGVAEFETFYNDAQQALTNRPELGLGVRFDDIRTLYDESNTYRLSGLLHAWKGAIEKDTQAIVRGMSMADL